MAATSPYIPLAGGGTARLWKKPGETWRRSRSNSAFLSDFIAREKALMLCLSCLPKMPAKWMSRYGYRLLRNYHTEGHCDLCKTFTTCDMFHPEQGDYVKEWDRLGAIEASIKAQQVEIRDKRRVR